MIPQFLNPLMLWGLAAASVPIVIHLLNRRRYRVQRWAAMEWLLAAARKNQKRLKMENLLLLLLRTAAVLFLALALARPTFSETRLALDKQAAHLFLLLDTSASMGAKTGTGTAFEKAQGDALSLLEEIGPDDAVTLVLTNDDSPGEAGARTTGRARVVLRGTHDHSKVRQILSDLKPAAARADLVESLKALEETVPARGGAAAKVAVLTDLQRASFEDAGTTGASAPDLAIRSTLTRLKEKGAEVVFVPPGRAPPNNVAITGLSTQSDRDIVKGATVVFVAEVRNYGDHAVNAEVRFLVDGEERGDVSQMVPLPARPAGAGAPPAGTAQFTALFDKDSDVGVHVLEARVAADALPIDDVRTFAFEVRKPLRILAVDGDPEPDGRDVTSETRDLKYALAYRDDGPFVVQVVGEAEYEAESDLGAWDVVVLANVKHPARGEQRRRLERYLRDGGAVLLSVGDQVDPAVWNEELRSGATPILPAELDAPLVDLTEATAFELDLAENKHPILADITHPGAGRYFRSPRFWGRMGLKDVSAEKGTRVLLTFKDYAKSVGPALLERSFGKGRVLLLATTLDTAWGRLPREFLYPALLSETVYYLASRGNSERNITTFLTWTRPLPENFSAIEAVAPDGSRIPASGERPADSTPYVAIPETGRPGAYRVTVALKPADILAAPPPPLMDAFAVNLTAAESDLARLRPEEVEARWPDLARAGSGFASAADAMRPKGGEAHAPLIVAALLCLIGEVLLVRRIAKSRTAGA